MSTTEAPSVASSFARIMRWADATLPQLRDSLRPGANEDDVRRLEALIGKQLPQEVRDLYRLADGQTPFQFGETPHYPGLFLGVPFNPIEIVMQHWRFNEDSIEGDNTDEFLSSFPPGTVKVVHYNGSWIPLSDDGGGNHMAIDLDPGPRGNVGQIIIFGSDEHERLRVCSSLCALLHWVAGEMEAGHFTQTGDDDALGWHGAGHLHDALRSHLRAGGQIG